MARYKYTWITGADAACKPKLVHRYSTATRAVATPGAWAWRLVTGRTDIGRQAAARHMHTVFTYTHITKTHFVLSYIHFVPTLFHIPTPRDTMYTFPGL